MHIFTNEDEGYVKGRAWQILSPKQLLPANRSKGKTPSSTASIPELRVDTGYLLKSLSQ